MDKIRIDDIDGRIDSATVKRPLTDAINAANVALNYYKLAPGDSFAYGYHMHEKQEELFVIQEGRVTFETEDGNIVVDAGEVIRFEPGEYQQGINRGDERVVALALGAPQETGGSEILRECDACSERTPNTVERAQDSQAKITRCLECGVIAQLNSRNRTMTPRDPDGHFPQKDTTDTRIEASTCQDIQLG